MADRSNFINRLRSVFADLSQRTTDQQFEARLDQEIHRAQEQVRLGNEQVAASHADFLAAVHKLSELRPELSSLEEQALRHLRARASAKARPVASKIASVSTKVREWEMRQAVAAQHEAEQRAMVEFNESVVLRLRRQIGLRRASINLQRSQEALARFGDPVARASQSMDVDAAPPETTEQVLTRLRLAAKSDKPVKAVKKTVKKAISSSTKNTKGGSK